MIKNHRMCMLTKAQSKELIPLYYCKRIQIVKYRANKTHLIKRMGRRASPKRAIKNLNRRILKHIGHFNLRLMRFIE